MLLAQVCSISILLRKSINRSRSRPRLWTWEVKAHEQTPRLIYSTQAQTILLTAFGARSKTTNQEWTLAGEVKWVVGSNPSQTATQCSNSSSQEAWWASHNQWTVKWARWAKWASQWVVRWTVTWWWDSLSSLIIWETWALTWWARWIVAWCKARDKAVELRWVGILLSSNQTAWICSISNSSSSSQIWEWTCQVLSVVNSNNSKCNSPICSPKFSTRQDSSSNRHRWLISGDDHPCLAQS